jgi:hypothetical protein
MSAMSRLHDTSVVPGPLEFGAGPVQGRMSVASVLMSVAALFLLGMDQRGPEGVLVHSVVAPETYSSQVDFMIRFIHTRSPPSHHLIALSPFFGTSL